eukprot:gene3937-7867_t
MARLVSYDVRSTYLHIIGRASTIFNRTKGYFTVKSILVQHLIPACRVARTMPHSTTSRFLIALNDYDLHYSTPRKDLHWEEAQNHKSGPFFFFMTNFTKIPHHLQKFLVDYSVLFIVNFIFCGLLILGRANWILAMVAAFVIIFIIIGAIILYGKGHEISISSLEIPTSLTTNANDSDLTRKPTPPTISKFRKKRIVIDDPLAQTFTGMDSHILEAMKNKQSHGIFGTLDFFSRFHVEYPDIAKVHVIDDNDNDNDNNNNVMNKKVNAVKKVKTIEVIPISEEHKNRHGDEVRPFNNNTPAE